MSLRPSLTPAEVQLERLVAGGGQLLAEVEGGLQGSSGIPGSYRDQPLQGSLKDLDFAHPFETCCSFNTKIKGHIHHLQGNVRVFFM